MVYMCQWAVYSSILAAAACIASASAKPSGFLPAPLVAAPLAYPAPVVASRTAQVVQTNFNTLAAPYYAAPAVAAPVLAARYAYAAPAVAAPVAARYAFPAPAVAAPVVAAPARLAAPAVAAPVPAAFAAPAVAPALPAPFPYYI
ncbi:unnamed protein product [Nezara viridula]|uniref:Neuropeptide n=1 Tax=Nezara viridula TaxID=85310 RepID=A0A9P0MGJ1_NEZVI|nr:unnamed protein product [Nezara viridula]